MYVLFNYAFAGGRKVKGSFSVYSQRGKDDVSKIYPEGSGCGMKTTGICNTGKRRPFTTA